MSGFIWRFDRWFVACVVWMVSAAVLMRRLLGPCLDGLSHFLIMFPIARALCFLSISSFLLNSAFLYPLHLVENPGRGSTVCWWNRGGSLYLSLTCLVIAGFVLCNDGLVLRWRLSYFDLIEEPYWLASVFRGTPLTLFNYFYLWWVGFWWLLWSWSGWWAIDSLIG